MKSFPLATDQPSLGEWLDHLIRQERKLIGTRIDSIRVLAGDDDSKVDWAAVVDALNRGEWPDVRPPKPPTRLRLAPGTWFRKDWGPNAKRIGKWHRVALRGWLSENGYCDCHIPHFSRAGVEFETTETAPPVDDRCTKTKDI